MRVAGNLVSLTPTEFRLLETMARHPERTFSRSELLARVFGPDYEGFGARSTPTSPTCGAKVESDG